VTGHLDERERKELRRKARAATLQALRALDGEACRSAVCERALADGGFTPRELAAPPPEAAAVKFDRFVDYALSWTLTNLKRDGLVENPSRGMWRLAGAALAAPALATGQPVFVDRAEELQRMSYREYLRTPEWRVTRVAALERAGHCCSLDITHADDLEVHHRTYERLGCELASDLTVLCHACHALHHKRFGRPGPRPARRESPPAAPVPRAAARERPSLLRRLFSA